ncbi:MAG: Ig-like domain-containing protein [Gemmatimonadales bacterium]
MTQVRNDGRGNRRTVRQVDGRFPAYGSALAVATSILAMACGGGPGEPTVPPPPPPPPPPPAIISVTLSPPTLTLDIGATGQLAVVVATSAGPVANPTVTWRSTAPAVATVAAAGANATVTGVTAGAARIVATSGTLADTTDVTVNAGGPPAFPTFDWRVIGATSTVGARGSDRWVAMTTAKAYGSTDGAAWRPPLTLGAWGPSDALWNGTRFVAIGAGGVRASDDGNAWTAAIGIGQAPGTATGKFSVAWTGAIHVASDAGRLYTSSDGLTWQLLTTAPAGAVTDLIWTGTLLAGNTGGVITTGVVVSADTGRTWAASPGLSGDLQSAGLYWDGTRFLKWRGRNLGTSPNGLAWTETPTTINWPVSGPAGVSAPIEDLTFNGTKYYALAHRTLSGVVIDGGAILESADGFTWTELDTSIHGSLKTFASGPGGSLMAFGGATLQTADGSSWAMRMVDFRGGQWPVTWSIDRWLALEPRALLVSLDGVTWRRYAFDLTSTPWAATWTGSVYVVGGDQGRVITSPDGLLWTARSVGMSDNVRDLIWAGGRLVALGQQGSVTSSTDGSTWSPRAVATRQFTDLEWTGTRYVIAAGDLTYVSADALTWQASAATPSPVSRIVWNGSELRGFNHFRVSRSTDGLSWTLEGDIDAIGNQLKLESAAWLGDVYVSCQTLSSNLLYSADLRHWFPAPTPEPLTAPCNALGWNGTDLLTEIGFGLSRGIRTN